MDALVKIRKFLFMILGPHSLDNVDRCLSHTLSQICRLIQRILRISRMNYEIMNGLRHTKSATACYAGAVPIAILGLVFLSTA